MRVAASWIAVYTIPWNGPPREWRHPAAIIRPPPRQRPSAPRRPSNPPQHAPRGRSEVCPKPAPPAHRPPPPALLPPLPHPLMLSRPPLSPGPRVVGDPGDLRTVALGDHYDGRGVVRASTPPAPDDTRLTTAPFLASPLSARAPRRAPLRPTHANDSYAERGTRPTGSQSLAPSPPAAPRHRAARRGERAPASALLFASWRALLQLPQRRFEQRPDLLIARLPSLRASAPAQGCSTAIRARVALAAREHAATDATGPRLRGYHGRTFGFWLDFGRRDRPRHGVSASGRPRGL